MQTLSLIDSFIHSVRTPFSAELWSVRSRGRDRNDSEGGWERVEET